MPKYRLAHLKICQFAFDRERQQNTMELITYTVPLAPLISTSSSLTPIMERVLSESEKIDVTNMTASDLNIINRTHHAQLVADCLVDEGSLPSFWPMEKHLWTLVHVGMNWYQPT